MVITTVMITAVPAMIIARTSLIARVNTVIITRFGVCTATPAMVVSAIMIAAIPAMIVARASLIVAAIIPYLGVIGRVVTVIIANIVIAPVITMVIASVVIGAVMVAMVIAMIVASMAATARTSGATTARTATAATAATAAGATAAMATSTAAATATAASSTTRTATATATIFGVRAGMGKRVRNQHGGCRQHPTDGQGQNRLFELHHYLHLLVLVIEPQTEPVQNEGHCPGQSKLQHISKKHTKHGRHTARIRMYRETQPPM
ncbi:hypothetical protein [Pseudomonas sp. NPDC088444]|uniref:hypothetical protein n=1 Tax=Pseudomonas sp. NPDC088444 TaxID=3364456 RepID=UPI00384A72F9